MELKPFATSRWYAFVEENTRLAMLWLAGVTLFMAFRVFFLFYFYDHLSSPLTLDTFATTLKAGFAFDSAAAGVCLAIPFIFNCFLQPIRKSHWVASVRHYSAQIYLSLSVLLCVVSVTYIAEYGSQFNYFMFEGLHDDQAAILKTVAMQYKPWGSVITLCVLLYFSFNICNWINRHQLHVLSNLFTDCKVKRTVLVIIMVVLTICAVRGSFESRPAMRKWSAVTPDPFANNLVINPLRSFIYAIRDYNELQSHGANSKNPYLANDQSISEPLINLKHTTTGVLTTQPSRIFLIIMESYDSWPLQEKYFGLGLTTQLQKLAEKGLYFPDALPAASSTMNSLSSILSGIPYAGVNMSKIGPQKPASPMSLFEQLEQQGYRSQFFYGGLLSWQNIGTYAKSQGVDRLYSAADMGGKGSAGVWGIDDQQLFELVANKAKENTFNVVMTTSYHGPFNLNLKQYGYPLESIDDYPSALRELNSELLSPYTLGHLWYADHMLGEFVDKMESQYPDALFVITGDHYSRRYIHDQPNLYELTHVPIVFYGQAIQQLKAEPQLASHMDIAPTILNLVAKPNSAFYSVGKSLLSPTTDRTIFGFQTARKGQQLWRGDFSGIYEYHLINEKQRYDVRYNKQSTPFAKIDEATFNAYNQYMGIAWHLLLKGEQ